MASWNNIVRLPTPLGIGTGTGMVLLLLLQQTLSLPSPAPARQRSSSPVFGQPITSIHSEPELVSMLEQVFNADRVAVVRFFASWCPVCQADHPKFETMVGKHLEEADFIEVDVDLNGGLTSEYGVTAVPTYFVLSKGSPKTTVFSAGDVDSKLSQLRK